MHLALILTVIGFMGDIGVWAHRPSSHSHSSSHGDDSHGDHRGHDKCNLCVDILKKNPHAQDKVYSLRIWDPKAKKQRRVNAFCDMTNGGYTLFQRRVDGNVSFAVDWTPYKEGFGNKKGSYWLGNDNIHLLTTYCGCQSLRVEMKACNGYRGEKMYKKFQIGDEWSGYEAIVSGSAVNMTAAAKKADIFIGDTRAVGINGVRFSTFGVDHDPHGGHCSASRGRGGFWWKVCGHNNLNGPLNASCPTKSIHMFMSYYGWPSRGWHALRQVSMGLIDADAAPPPRHKATPSCRRHH